MVPGITEDMQRAAYRIVVDELQSMNTETGSCPQLPDPVVDAAVRHILDMPNNWGLITISAIAPFMPQTQAQLALAATILMTPTFDWDDFDESGLSVSQVRIAEVMGYVDEENLPEELRD